MAAVGLSITEIAAILHSMFLNTLFGNTVLLGIFIIFLVYVWISKSGAHSLGIMITGMAALAMYLAGVGSYTGGYLPAWVGMFIIVIIAVLFGAAFLKHIGSKK